MHRGAIRAQDFSLYANRPAVGAILVVGDAAALTAGDTIVRTQMQKLGWTVTLKSDDDAADFTQAVAVIAESCSAAVIAAKYRFATCPVVVLEPGVVDDMDMATLGANNVVEDNVSILTPGSTAAGGFAGLVNVMAPAARVDYSNAGELAASAVQVYETQDVATRIACYTYATGALMLNAHNAEARRVFCGLAQDVAILSATTNALALVRAAMSFALSG